MRNLLGVLAGVALMIGVVGVAQASDTGFGEWGTPYYDQVIGDHTVNYVGDYSPADDYNSVSYMGNSGCTSCDSGYSAPVYESSLSCSGGYDYNWGGDDSGPIEYGDDGWDWYTL